MDIAKIFFGLSQILSARFSPFMKHRIGRFRFLFLGSVLVISKAIFCKKNISTFKMIKLPGTNTNSEFDW